MTKLTEPPLARETGNKDGSRGLDKFFEPKSVAVIGASGTPHKAGNDVIKNILGDFVD